MLFFLLFVHFQGDIFKKNGEEERFQIEKPLMEAMNIIKQGRGHNFVV